MTKKLVVFLTIMSIVLFIAISGNVVGANANHAHHLKSTIETESSQSMLKATSYLNLVTSSQEGLSKQSEQKVSDQMLDVLVKNRDNLFPIRSLENEFSNIAAATYSDVGSATAVQTSTQDGQHNILMFANADSIHDYNVVTKLIAWNLQNFLFSMKVTLNDVYPKNQGGCFIGYTNEPVNAVKTEETVETISFLMSDSSVMLYVKEKEAKTGAFSPISSSTGQGYQMKLTIVRLTGQTFFFLGDKFIGQHHDGNSGPFQLVYGTTVFANGDTANCSFDNLVVRKVVN